MTKAKKAISLIVSVVMLLGVLAVGVSQMIIPVSQKTALSLYRLTRRHIAQAIRSRLP